MRGTSDHIGEDVGLVVAAVWMIVVGAWIALSGRFEITVAMLVVGAVAVIAAGALITRDARRGGRHRGRGR